MKKNTKMYPKEYEFKETFPKVGKTVVPGNIPLSEWQENWAKIERKPIREQLKEMSNEQKAHFRL